MKVWNYVVIIIGMALLFELAGMSVHAELLNKIGFNLAAGTFSLKTSALYLGIFGTAGILIGLDANITQLPIM